MENPLFLNQNHLRLFCFEHIPENQIKACVIFCPPLLEEKLWSHRNYVSLARLLSAHGIMSVRFDYIGTGDSSGELRETSIDTNLRDIDLLVQRVLEVYEPPRLGIFGLRYGASIAQLYCALNPSKIHFTVFWEPLESLQNYALILLRSHAASQMVLRKKVPISREQLVSTLEHDGIVAIDGYEFSGKFYKSMQKYDRIFMDYSWNNPTYIIFFREISLKKFNFSFSTHKNYEVSIVNEIKLWGESKKNRNSADQCNQNTCDWILRNI